MQDGMCNTQHATSECKTACLMGARAARIRLRHLGELCALPSDAHLPLLYLRRCTRSVRTHRRTQARPHARTHTDTDIHTHTLRRTCKHDTCGAHTRAPVHGRARAQSGGVSLGSRAERRRRAPFSRARAAPTPNSASRPPSSTSAPRAHASPLRPRSPHARAATAASDMRHATCGRQVQPCRAAERWLRCTAPRCTRGRLTNAGWNVTCCWLGRERGASVARQAA